MCLPGIWNRDKLVLCIRLNMRILLYTASIAPKTKLNTGNPENLKIDYLLLNRVFVKEIKEVFPYFLLRLISMFLLSLINQLPFFAESSPSLTYVYMHFEASFLRTCTFHWYTLLIDYFEWSRRNKYDQSKLNSKNLILAVNKITNLSRWQFHSFWFLRQLRSSLDFNFVI